jgi:ferredoxin--NADP+ reductase
VHGLTQANAASDPDGAAKVSELQALQRLVDSPPRIDVNFYFGWTPESIDGRASAESATFCATHSKREHLTIDTDSVITAVGFSAGARDRFVRADFVGELTNPEHGILDKGLYCTGWFGKGASGTIPEHRAESRSVALAIANELSAAPTGVRKQGLSALPAHVLENSVDFNGWKAVDGFELASAASGRYRLKVRKRAEMLAIAREAVTQSAEEKVS